MGGTFDPSNSKTYHITVPDGFNTSFGDGSTATGPYAADTVAIGDVVLENVQFGVADAVNSYVASCLCRVWSRIWPTKWA